jgi:hypothetical protein
MGYTTQTLLDRLTCRSVRKFELDETLKELLEMTRAIPGG